MDNVSQHFDEIEALASIYGQDWKMEDETGTTYSMQVNPDVKLFITFIPEYPSDKPPKYEMTAPLLTLEQKTQVDEELEKMYSENFGGPILFQWIERIKELLQSWETETKNEKLETTMDNSLKQEAMTSEISCSLKLTHGPLIQDRKSVFQGHACKVTTPEEIKNFMNYLLSNKKIAQATHNISAYRIKLQNGGILQDCDDDGETHAGGRLLHLLQIIDVIDVAVVVTRWYGGIHLGPDRFRHINNAARQVLVEGRFIKS